MRQVILEVLPEQTVMAVVKDGRLTEFEVERPEESSLVGRVYKGIVRNVVPVVKGLFVDIGVARNAFLRLADWPEGKEPPTEGMSILVQVMKDATPTKGPLVTGRVSLPGRYCVLLTDTSYIGISRKIHSDKVRGELRQMGRSLCPEGMGLIVRTAAEEASSDDVSHEIRQLVSCWQIIEKRARLEKAPVRLYQESDLLVRCLREYVTADTEEIIVDDHQAWSRLQSLAEEEHILSGDAVRLYEEPEPILDYFGVTDQVDELLSREVSLPSGGSLVIDYTEALTAIDVNSGSFHRKGIPHGEAACLINREAAVEIARQIRLRGIGGIIMIDFIDMDKASQKEEIVRILRKAVSHDRVRTVVCGMTSLGLVEMTRKRTSYRLGHYHFAPCEACAGRGRVMSMEAILTAVHRAVRSRVRQGRAGNLVIECHPDVAAALSGKEEQAYFDAYFHMKPRITARDSMKKEVFSLLMENS